MNKNESDVFFDELIREEMRMEENFKKTNQYRYSCSDGFCGAEDCCKCYPENLNDNKENE